jgi:predicted MPP superfamily phosphohydrolase
MRSRSVSSEGESLFGVILISVVTLTQIYVLWRASSLPLFRRQVNKKWLVTGSTFLWLLFLIGRMYGHDNPAAFVPVLQLAGMTWMGMLLLIAISLFATDLVTGFGFFLPKLAPSLRGAALICGLALSLIAMVQGTRAPVVRNQDVELSGLPANLDGMVIVGLSDLHIGATLDGKWLEQRVSQVLAERPDMIVLLGDIFEGHGEPTIELAAGLKGLTAPMGVWAVLGNHELHGRENGIVQIFRRAGIIVLRNEQTTIRTGLLLAGVDDLTSNYRSGLKSDLVTKTLGSPPSGARILLSHTPWNADRAAKAGAGLMLCGHTHGGQIWPFGYLVRMFYPLLAGRYDVDGMTVIVSRGAGTWGPRMRLWQPGEIIRITLKAKKKVA